MTTLHCTTFAWDITSHCIALHWSSRHAQPCVRDHRRSHTAPSAARPSSSSSTFRWTRRVRIGSLKPLRCNRPPNLELSSRGASSAAAAAARGAKSATARAHAAWHAWTTARSRAIWRTSSNEMMRHVRIACVPLTAKELSLPHSPTPISAQRWRGARRRRGRVLWGAKGAPWPRFCDPRAALLTSRPRVRQTDATAVLTRDPTQLRS